MVVGRTGTALWLILDTMTKLFAPILAFTCDEIWLAMPHRKEDDPRAEGGVSGV